MTSDLRFGIVQGRLSQCPPGELQWFPQQHWRDEFSLAAEIGIDYIELIAEVQHNPDTPIWGDACIEEIISLVTHNDLSLHALCNDYVIKNSLIDDPEVFQQNLDLVARGSLLGVEKLILPLFEHSELTLENMDDFVGPLRAIADKANEMGMVTCLETILTGSELMMFLEKIDRSWVKVVYDTGNRVAFGHDLPADIRLLGSQIAHIHIKDKNKDNANVIVSTGLVNFKEVFEAINDIGYHGPFTFETQRGNDPVRTARFNMMLTQYFFDEGQG